MKKVEAVRLCLDLIAACPDSISEKEFYRRGDILAQACGHSEYLNSAFPNVIDIWREEGSVEALAAMLAYMEKMNAYVPDGHEEGAGV